MTSQNTTSTSKKFKLTHYPPAGLPVLYYMLPFLVLWPWLAALQWLWKVRRTVRNGALDETGASMCFGIITALLAGAYTALIVVEVAFTSGWKL